MFKRYSATLAVILSFYSISLCQSAPVATSLESLSFDSLAPSEQRQIRIGIGREHGLMTQQLIYENPIAENNSWEIKLSIGNSQFFSGDNNQDKRAYAAQASYLHSLGKNTYASAGIFYRDYRRVNLTGIDEFQDFGPQFSIGSRWTFRQLNLNVIWAGANPSVASIKQQGDRPEMFLTLLNISAGVSF